eukprot:CAMPEP_0177763444 /NCGR_PEP_ID=MMETSP0491_2-20121128/6877_1 /TAXON_ID=63592 /ORGANISM="Tetraselmis chuii, Strain PLY429" /LENGTH=388 /DNA_ID=CAMNT_0019279557 /DNA_START=135 /DNA_END=1301 /DNA_ORIENTATION=-
MPGARTAVAGSVAVLRNISSGVSPEELVAAQPWTIPFADQPDLLNYDNGFEINEILYDVYQARRLDEISGFLKRIKTKIKNRELTVGVLMPERKELSAITAAFQMLGARIEGISGKQYHADRTHLYRHELLVSYSYHPLNYWPRLVAGNHTLVVEKAYFRGKIKGRYEQSYTWDGVNNGGIHPSGHAGRWASMRKFLGPKPWKLRCPKTVLVLGQETLDRTQYPIRRRFNSPAGFLQKNVDSILSMFPTMKVLFRAHPGEVKTTKGLYFRPKGAIDVSTEDFRRTMARVHLVVTANSGAAIEAMANGLPVLAGDPSFMGWNCAIHRVDDLRPSITLRFHDECFHQIAVAQWSSASLKRRGLSYILNPDNYKHAVQQKALPIEVSVFCP